jgi:hypothetical protein
MIVIVGLVILIAAVVAGVAGILSNSGSAHALTHSFTVLGYHFSGSAGTLFLYGIVVGALGLFGLSLLLAGARRTSRRGSAARRGLKLSRRETAAVSKVRDDLIDERETARANAEGARANPAASGDRPVSPDPGQRRGPHPWRRAAQRKAAATRPETANGQPAADVPASAPAPAG